MDSRIISRAEFLRGTALVAAASSISPAVRAVPPSPAIASAGEIFDLRDFVRWITDELEPAVRLPGRAGSYARQPGQTTPELYGVADMACILHTLGRLHPTPVERTQWQTAFQEFQNPATGWLVEKSPTHHPLHNTAFALAAMELLDLRPRAAVIMGPAYADPVALLDQLDWKKAVYHDSHQGAGVGTIFALVPELRRPDWFARYFATCDCHFDPRNGLMGEAKPAGGDFDQIGGTFHYSFLYENFNRHMPYPEARIDAVLGLQRSDGYWTPANPLWLTLDAIFLLTRTSRYCPHRFAEIQTSVRKALAAVQHEISDPDGRRRIFSGPLTVHLVTAALSIAAEAQKFLGTAEVITEEPLRLVLDRRPFI